MAVNVGVLGFAHGHVGTYCRRWTDEAELGVRVVAGWDRDAERLAGAAKEYGCEAAASAEALCGRADVSAVVIGAETLYHAELVEMAAAAGKAIVLQKPLALTLEQGDRIVAAVEKAGVPFTLAWQMRVDPQNLALRQRVAEGGVGRVFMVRRRHGLSTHVWGHFETTWHNDPKLNRDIFADDASHAIDFLYWMLGKPVSVMAELATLHSPRVPNDNGLAIFRYADGTLAELSCSFVCLAGENTTEVVGSEGVIIQNYGDAPSANAPRPEGGIGLKWYRHGDKSWTVSDIASPANHGWRIANVAGPLAEFLQGRRGPIATARQGRDVLAITLACYESSETGCRVSLG